MKKGLFQTTTRSLGTLFVVAALLLGSLPAIAVVDPPADPLPPINLSVSNITETSITLTWEGGNGGPIDKFVIMQNSQWGLKNVEEIDSLAGPVTYLVTGLLPNTAYTFLVAGKNSLTGAVSSFTETSPEYTHASTPSQLIATPVSDTEVNLAWTTNGTYSWIENLTTGQEYHLSAFVKNYTITGLTCNTNYTVDVIATNEVAVPTPPSQALVINAGPCTHFAPIEIHHDNVTTSSLDLFWTVDPKGAEDTVVIKQVTQFGETTLAEVNRALVSYHVTGLTPNTGYTFKVAAKDKNGISGYLTDAPVYTLASVPWDISVTADSRDQMTLNWKNDGTYVVVENITNGDSTGLVQRATSAVFTKLNCGTPYEFRLKATNENGIETAYTDNLRKYTQECEPTARWSSWGGSGSGAVSGAPDLVLGTKIFATSATSTEEENATSTTKQKTVVKEESTDTTAPESRLDQLIRQTAYGQKSDDIKELQTILRQLGYFPHWVRSTGYYLDITKAAVAKYQASK